MGANGITGTIIRLRRDKGYGFIQADGAKANHEYFFHMQDCVDTHFETLTEGQRVSFTEGTSDKGNGLRALNVNAGN